MKFIFYFGVFSILFSCKKDSESTEIALSGTITIQQPTAGDTLQIDSTFMIETQIVANKELHGHYLVVYNQNDQSVVYEHQVHEHGESYQLRDTVSMVVSAVTPLRIVIEAAGDHAGELLTKECLFWVKP